MDSQRTPSVSICFLQNHLFQPAFSLHDWDSAYSFNPLQTDLIRWGFRLVTQCSQCPFRETMGHVKNREGKNCNHGSVEAGQALGNDGLMSVWHRSEHEPVELMRDATNVRQRHSESLHMAEWVIWGRLLARAWGWASGTAFPLCARALGSCENNALKSNCNRAELTFQKINYGTELETSFWKLHHTSELDTCCFRKICGNGCWLHCYFPPVWEKVFLLFVK